MIFLILDTNIWLYLANGLDTITSAYHKSLHFELLQRLKELVSRREVVILKNSIIVSEWNRNKGHAYEQVSRLKSQADSIFAEGKKLIKRLDYTAAEDKFAEKNRLNELAARNEAHIDAVEDFLLNDCTEVPITDQIKVRVTDIALEKLAPFHNQKNNVADAIILLSAATYLKGGLDSETMAFFVSNNSKEFADNEHPDHFHPDILSYLPTRDISYRTYLPEVLKVSEDIIEDMREFYRLQSISFPCGSIVCSGREDFERHGYLEEETNWLYASDRLNMTQLDLFTGKIKPEENRGMIKFGHCIYCGTLHVICPRCSELICAEQEGHFQCEECKTEFAFEINHENGTRQLVWLDIENNGHEEDEDED